MFKILFLASILPLTHTLQCYFQEAENMVLSRRSCDKSTNSTNCFTKIYNTVEPSQWWPYWEKTEEEIIDLGCMTDSECAKGVPACDFPYLNTPHACVKSVNCCKGNLCNTATVNSSLFLVAIIIIAFSFISN